MIDVVLPQLGRAFDAALTLRLRPYLVDGQVAEWAPTRNAAHALALAAAHARGYVLNLMPGGGDRCYRAGVVMEGAGPDYHTATASEAEGPAAAVARALWIATEIKAARDQKKAQQEEEARQKEERRQQKKGSNDDA